MSWWEQETVLWLTSYTLQEQSYRWHKRERQLRDLGTIRAMEVRGKGWYYGYKANAHEALRCRKREYKKSADEFIRTNEKPTMSRDSKANYDSINAEWFEVYPKNTKWKYARRSSWLFSFQNTVIMVQIISAGTYEFSHSGSIYVNPNAKEYLILTPNMGYEFNLKNVSLEVMKKNEWETKIRLCL